MSAALGYIGDPPFRNSGRDDDPEIETTDDDREQAYERVTYGADNCDLTEFIATNSDGAEWMFSLLLSSPEGVVSAAKRMRKAWATKHAQWIEQEADRIAVARVEAAIKSAADDREYESDECGKFFDGN